MLEIKGKNIRDDFPALERKVNEYPLVYLDSAASTLKPKQVAQRIHDFYLYESSNVHRGAHTLSDLATGEFERSRETVRRFINAKAVEEVVFTKGTTESINLVAHTFGAEVLKPDDEILITQMEHHSNIVPWQLIAQKTGARVRFIPITDDGELDLSGVEKYFTTKTKILSVTHCSNVLGTVNPVRELCKMAREKNITTVVDGAQAVSVLAVDVQDLDCDFYAFSAHKLFGPYGVGILYGRKELLQSLPPYQGGGSMIQEVSEDGVSFLPPPQRFEAGTPHIAGAIGLAEAIKYFEQIGVDKVKAHEQELLKEANDQLREISGIKIFGASKNKVNILSFVVDGAHHSDLGVLLDRQGVAVRAGHHCCQPLMKRLGVGGTVRASFSIYNTLEDVRCLRNSLEKAVRML